MAEQAELGGSPRRSSRSHLARAAATFVGAALWIGLPVVALWATWDRASAASLTAPEQTWVPVEEAPPYASTSAQLILSWSPTLTLQAPAWSGVVQEVFIAPGDEVANGTAVCRINNVMRLAWHTEVPLFRPIGLGDRGPDVLALNRLLAEQDLAPTSGDIADAQTVRGIRAFAQSIGAGDVDSFDPAWLVYLPAPLTLDQVMELAVGGQAPPAGADLAVSRPTLVEAHLAEWAAESEQGSPTAGGRPLGLRDGQQVHLRDGAPGTGPLTTGVDGSVTASDALARVALVAQPGQDRLDVQILTHLEPNSWALPWGALVHDQSATCVVVRREDSTATVPVATPTEGPGRIYVVGNLQTRDMVLVAPMEQSCSPRAR